MEFKKWIESSRNIEKQSEKFFNRKSINKKIDSRIILTALGLPTTKKLVVFNDLGSTSTIYEYPEDPTKLIKVTGDMSDARAFKKIKDANLKSTNIVNCYMVKKISPNAAMIVVDKVDGDHMKYSTSMFLGMIEGNSYEDACSASISVLENKLDPIREKILNELEKNNIEEKIKLSNLFKTICKLEKMGIDFFDFDSNILDTGRSYVIVDLGQ
jgi:hypothetical protein